MSLTAARWTFHPYSHRAIVYIVTWPDRHFTAITRSQPAVCVCRIMPSNMTSLLMKAIIMNSSPRRLQALTCSLGEQWKAGGSIRTKNISSPLAKLAETSLYHIYAKYKSLAVSTLAICEKDIIHTLQICSAAVLSFLFIVLYTLFSCNTFILCCFRTH